MIYLKGSQVEILTQHFGIPGLEVRRVGDGVVLETHEWELRADGGIPEIMDAVCAAMRRSGGYYGFPEGTEYNRNLGWTGRGQELDEMAAHY